MINMIKVILYPEQITMSPVMKQQSKEVYTTREAAELLGVSLRTVQLWVENGVLNAWKTAGGHRRISRESVDFILVQQQGALYTDELDKEIKILVIEDDLDLLELYSLRIELWDLPIKVLTAISGYEGLIKIGEHLPDIVIVDLILPNMDGFQLIKTIANVNQYKDIHIIVVSALTDEDIKQRGGIDKSIARLKKPISFAKLHQLVAEKMFHKIQRLNKRR